MTDDVGFGATSTFGGPVPTPNLDRLAAEGIRYTEFQTTAICSATRAALLTGRNHHAVGMGLVPEMATPYPGYDGVIPKSAATIAEILRDNGYATAMFGKHHDVPNNELAGPYDEWPTGLGFDYFYGFIGGDTDQFHPHLYADTVPVDDTNRPKDYILDKDLADHAIAWIHQEQSATPSRPFFIYYAPGATHAPHQAPAAWIAKFHGKFNEGWDQLRVETLARQKAMGIFPPYTDLSARPAEIPAWNSLTPDEKIVDERYMEDYAGMLAYDDAQIGRIIDEIQRMGIADNTIIVFIVGDNGASGEGGPYGTLDEVAGMNQLVTDTQAQAIDHWLTTHLSIMGGPDTEENYPVGWALAMDTPYPWTKQIASHLGGVRNGLVIAWPGHITKTGGFRTQYHHVIDITPTLLDVAHVQAPSVVNGIPQQPFDGVSMVYSFNDPNAPSTRDTQYYEIDGNRGIYHDGWLANTTPRHMPWEIDQAHPNSDVTTYQWELYDLQTDPSQAHNLAAKYPDRLKAMQALFDQQARKYNVYPIQDSGAPNRVIPTMIAEHAFKLHFVFWGSGAQLPFIDSPEIAALPFSIVAQIDVPQGGANGVIAAVGSMFGGWSFYLKDGVPTAYAAASDLPGQQSRVAAVKPLSPGHHTLQYELTWSSGGSGVLTISDNGVQIAQGKIAVLPRSIAGVGETFDIGRDTGGAVTTDYSDDGVFTGQIEKVVVDLKLPPRLQAVHRQLPDPD